MRAIDAEAIAVAESRRVAHLAAGLPAPRVLIAEDDADSRRLLTMLLEQTGFIVQAVNDGAQAVAAFQSWQPDFIWLDKRMPAMDGYEVARRIRALPGGESVRIVALTASAFHEDRGAIIAAGCAEVLSKSLDENRLFALMAQLLGLHFAYITPTEKAAAPGTAPPVSELPALPVELRQPLARAARELDVAAGRELIAPLRRSGDCSADRAVARRLPFRSDRRAGRRQQRSPCPLIRCALHQSVIAKSRIG